MGHLLRDDALKAHAMRCLEERGAIRGRPGIVRPGVAHFGDDPLEPKRAQIFAIE